MHKCVLELVAIGVFVHAEQIGKGSHLQDSNIRQSTASGIKASKTPSLILDLTLRCELELGST